jgi:hypothetical protein
VTWREQAIAVDTWKGEAEPLAEFDPIAEDRKIKETLDYSEKAVLEPAVASEYHDSLNRIEKTRPITIRSIA